ncbi:MAG: hemerythrin domain-containing protein [Natronospirillum sp.]|uniref:hemerythrin domain-containing protein n=1 Tax=Natronospirillum sp. TaxID=2812955 RepID=UPI0025DB84B3|nr:hemerythrin domain-containing protein [Natronospirillum sp.]MCH8551669.1 hemerythrin domain-containing protein [Natronospirillum sp.]
MTLVTDAREGTDALSLLTKDHRDIETAFAEYEKLSQADTLKKRKSLADHIGNELLKHMAIEEDVFYPAIRDKVPGAEGAVKEGIVEHGAARNMIKQIKSMKGNEELFDSKVKVLSELIQHHVEEEEKDMFPKVEASDLDLEALAKDMAGHKATL